MRTTDRFHDIRLTFELLALMIQYEITLMYSLALFTTIMFRNSIQDVTKFLLSMSKISSDDVLGSLYKLRIRLSDQLRTVLELYEMEIHQKISMPNFQKKKKMKTMVKRSIDQKLRLRNFDAKHGKSKQGQWSRVERWYVALKDEKVHATSGKKKGQCSKGDQCSFRHESNDRAQKPTPKAATPSEPSMTRGRSTSPKRSVTGKSNTGRILWQPSRYYLKRYLSEITLWLLAFSRMSIPQNRIGMQKNKCLFPHYRVEEQTQKAEKELLTLKTERATTRVAIVKTGTTIGMCLARLRAIRISEGNSSGETRCEKFWDQFDEYDSHSLHYVKQVSEKIKDHHLENYKPAKSLLCEIGGQISRRDWKTRAMRPRQGMESCQKYVQAQRKWESYILFAFWRVGYAHRVHHQNQRKESLR